MLLNTDLSVSHAFFCIHASWWSSLEKTNWLHHISLLMKATNVVVNAIDKEQRPVVVHCSDGWDRTTQLVALAELMLDPYYRTIEVRKLKPFLWGICNLSFGW